jgi:hypothetical protein
MLIHRPPESGADTDLWEGLIHARADVLARDIGLSNYLVEQIEEVIHATGEVLAVNQIEWSPFGWTREMLNYCRERHIVIQAYSPLTRVERLNDHKLVKIAADYGKSSAQLVVRWNLQLGCAPTEGEHTGSLRGEPARLRLRNQRRGHGQTQRTQRAVVITRFQPPVRLVAIIRADQFPRLRARGRTLRLAA